MAVWSDLPVHVLDIIAQYLTHIEDFASFSAISKECQLVMRSVKKKSLLPRYPRLMLAENKDEPVRGFVNLLTSKTFGVELPEAKGSKCIGAHYGWLFVLGSDLQINLLHPFSRQQICLPSMLTFPNQCRWDEAFTPQMMLDVYVRKIAISASPLRGNNLNDECVIVAIYEDVKILAFARLGDTVWTNIQGRFHVCDDVIYYKGKFYAVSLSFVVVCDIDGNNSPKTIVVARAPSENCNAFQNYLVESSGDLLLVCRERGGTDFEPDEEEEEKDDADDNDNEEDNKHNGENNINNGSDKKEEKASYYTIGFSVWRLDESRDGGDYLYELTEVTTLGNRALFLGLNVSTSVAASNGIKENCIYFTDDDVESYSNEPGGGGQDVGIFNMEDGSIEFGYAGNSRSKLSPPIWYI